MRIAKRLVVAVAGAAIAAFVADGATAAAAGANHVVASDCALTVGNVSYSANMLYVRGWLAGGCLGQIEVDLQLASSASGPFITVDSSATYPADENAHGGTAWFTDAYQRFGCEFYYRGVGTYGELTAVSPIPRHPC